MSKRKKTTTLLSDVEQNNLKKQKKPISINEDILEEILIRLPLKSLHRCKSLSKFSLFYITSPQFIKRYFLYKRTHIKSLMLGFFYQPSHVPNVNHSIKFIPASNEGKKLKNVGDQKKFGMRIFDESLHFLRSHKNNFSNSMMVNVIASSNGLLLYKWTKKFDIDYRYYCVCNPIIKQWLPLPTPPKANLDCLTEGFVCESNSTYPCLDWVSYKVVRVVQDAFYSCHLDVEIFSSGTGKWVELKLVTTSPNQGIRVYLKAAISDRGTVCVTAQLRENYEYCCIAFDLNEKINQLHVIRDPPPGHGIIRKMGYSEGNVHLIRYNYKGERFLHVWELDEENYCKCGSEMKWFLKYRINLAEVLSQYGYPSCELEYEAIHPVNSSIVLLNLNDRDKVLLDTKNKSLELISEFTTRNSAGYYVPYYWQCWPPLAV